MKIQMPNYDECITNIACSMLKYFEVEYTHNTIKEIDDYLEKNNPKNVVVILYDGMGYNLLNRNLDNNSFLKAHLVKKISSVCPSTTTASTTSMLSGLNPCEHGWLGWDVYIKDEDKIVTLFLNTIKGTEEIAADYNVANKYLKYQNIISKINAANKFKAVSLFPFGKGNVYKDINDMHNKIIEECKKDGKKYIYAYYEDPDSTMHVNKTDSKATLDVFKLIDEKTKELCDKLDDTLVIITADHGHMNSDGFVICDYKDFYDTLDGDVSIEPRFCSFKIKKGYENRFVELFNKYFKDYFVLKSKSEIIREKIFGIGKEHKEFRNSLGDYIAIAKSNKYFRYSHNSYDYPSMHAGICEDEMLIPLILVKKK